jgi:hypothetical protein
LAILPLALSFWVKQSSLAPMVAVGLFLLLRDRRLVVRWGLWAVGSIVVPFLALDLLLKGGLHTHVLAFDHYGRSLPRLAKNLDALWTNHAPLVICALGVVLFYAWLFVSRTQSPKSKIQSHVERYSALRTPHSALPLSVLYLLVATPAALLSNTLPTANYNHLLDILAPLCLAAGVAFGAAWNGLASASGSLAVWGRGAVAIVVVLLAFVQVALLYAKPAWQWYTPLGMPLAERAARMEKLSQEVAHTEGDVLSEDNWLLLKNGKRVLYDDPAAMAALSNAGAWDQSTLLADINRRKFPLVILQYDLTTETYNPRWSNQALDALKANYGILFRDVLFAHAPRPPSAQPETGADCALAGGPLLRGYTFRSTTANHGDNLPLRLYWAKGATAGNPHIKFFVRLLDAGGNPKWSADLPPGGAAGKPFSSGWAGDETVRDDLRIPVAPDIPFGRYRLAVGGYTVDDAGGITPAPMVCAGSPESSPDVTVAEIEIVERWGK